MGGFFSLENKVAVITGGYQGIGLTAAERLAGAGAGVVIGDLNDCSEIARRIGGLYVKTDVSKEEQVQNLMQTAHDTFGRIDIIVNNAGVAPDYDSLLDAGREDYEMCFRINTMGVIFGMKHGAPLMNEGGSIINTSSLSGIRGTVGLSAYCTSKFSVVGITKTAALELAEKKIRVNAICPTSVKTPMALAEGGESFLSMEKLMIPLGRICEPEEVAALIHFLAADDCGFITGQPINICGGASAGVSMKAWDMAESQVEPDLKKG